MLDLFGSHPVSLLVRLVHVASMAFMLGGGLLSLGMVVQTGQAGANRPPGGILAAIRAYERYFWLAVGLIVLTGVGNLGALGANLPGPDTVWGTRLAIKLSLVLGLILLSLPRTLVAAGLSGARVLRVFYTGTALLLTAILLLAVSLAHG